MQALTPATAMLFRRFVADAPNWSGTPMVDVTKEERGNLTQLKRVGLLTTFTTDGFQFVKFTEQGVARARELLLPDADLLKAGA